MKRGSNTEENKFYHKNFFGDELHQRLDSNKRARKIIDNYNFNNKRVLDLGCNIGYFSFSAAQTAKEVIGIDYDTDAIDFANKMKTEHNINNVQFINSKITIEELEKIGKVDCVFGLAVHSWIMHESGREEMEKILDWMSKNSKVCFIELQYKGEPGELSWIENDEQCRKYLNKWFKYAYDICKVSGWGPRTIWKCLNDFGKFKEIYRNNKTICSISDNYIFKKEKMNKNMLFDNEIMFLNKLQHEYFIPKVVDYNETELYLSGINGMDINKLIMNKIDFENINIFKEALFEIYYSLENNNIKHQDINLENIIVSQTGKLYLVDFEYASFLNAKNKNPICTKTDNLTMCKQVIKKLLLREEFMK